MRSLSTRPSVISKGLLVRLQQPRGCFSLPLSKKKTAACWRLGSGSGVIMECDIGVAWSATLECDVRVRVKVAVWVEAQGYLVAAGRHAG